MGMVAWNMMIKLGEAVKYGGAYQIFAPAALDEGCEIC